MFVFVSYSSKNKNVADALCHYLEEHNIPCWIAPRDILPGQTWAGAIVQAISNCSAMVLNILPSQMPLIKWQMRLIRPLAMERPLSPLLSTLPP